MFGAKIANTKDNGKTIRCMAMEKQNGLMEESMKGNMTMIKSMGLVLSTGQMDVSIMGPGRMESNMVEESTIWCQDKRELVNGYRVRE